MTFFIDGKKYSDISSSKVLDQIILEIKKLPEPVVAPFEGVKGKVSGEETLICLQREAIYIDEFNPTNAFRYLGSKNVNSCLMAYLYNETDHFGIHVDNTTNFNLAAMLSACTTPSLSIVLVGGTTEQQSEVNLRNLLTELAQTANALNFTLTFVSQKIIERNKFSEADRADFIYDKIIEKADMVSRKYFGRSLDLSHFSPRTAQDLITRESTCNERELTLIASLFSQVGEIYSESKKSNIEMIHTFARSSGILPKAEEKDSVKIEQIYQKFLHTLGSLFSKQGFKLSQQTYQSIYPYAKLRNFVFDIKNHTVQVISAHQRSTMAESEIERSVVVLDAFTTPSYHLFYNGQTGMYQFPALSEEFLKKCESFKKTAELSLVSDEEIKKFGVGLRIPSDIPTRNVVMRYIKNCSTVQPGSGVVSVFYKLPYNFHHDQEVVNSNLQVLQSKYPELNITAKIRHYPKYTVDALVSCKDISAAQEIKTLLKKEKIICHLLKIAEKTYVCIPAINVAQYAEALHKLLKPSPTSPSLS